MTPVYDAAPARTLVVTHVEEAVAFYTATLDAVELHRQCLLDGRILSAELAIGPHRLLIKGDEASEEAATSNEDDAPLVIGYEHPEVVLERLLAAGAETEPSTVQSVIVRDRVGQRWMLVQRPASMGSAAGRR